MEYVETVKRENSLLLIPFLSVLAAFPFSNETNSDAEFAYGAGQINPLKAVNPGLIYDANEVDYTNFLCGLGYDKDQLQLVTGDNKTCSQAKNQTVWDLNCPSYTLSVSAPKYPASIHQSFYRTVTNVGSPKSIYNAKISAPSSLDIKVQPSILSFTALGQKLSFEMTIQGRIGTPILSSALVWDDGVHQVRSPIVVYVLRL